MIARVTVWLLEVGWVAAWALHLGVGWVPIALMAPAAMAAGLLRRRTVLAGAVWVVAAAVGALLSHVWGAAPVLYAMWRGASPPDPEHPAVFARLNVALAGTASLTYVSPSWAWTIPATLILALASSVEVHRDAETPRHLQLQAAGWLASLGAAAGLATLAVVLSPLWHLVGTLFRGILYNAGPLSFNALSRLLGSPVPHVGRRKPVHLRHLLHPKPVAAMHHAPAGNLTWLWLGLGALVLGGLLGYLVHRQRRLPTGPGPRDAAEERLARSCVDPSSGIPDASQAVVLTRRVVQTQMRREAQRRLGPQRGETVREWMGRLYGSDAAALASLYEEVRYGGLVDDVRRARTLQTAWPPARHPANPRGSAPQMAPSSDAGDGNVHIP